MCAGQLTDDLIKVSNDKTRVTVTAEIPMSKRCALPLTGSSATCSSLDKLAVCNDACQYQCGKVYMTGSK